MGLRERELWMQAIEKKHVPEHIKDLMRQCVHAHDRTLTQTLGNMELLYLRLVQHANVDCHVRRSIMHTGLSSHPFP